MTALLGWRGRAATSVPERLAALEEAVSLGEGRLPEGPLAEARSVVSRAGQRLRLSGEHTVVALAGATGSGKSTLFNALTGVELSRTGVRRPTTSDAHAAVWGGEGAEDLLDWLGVPRRHRVEPAAAAGGVGADAALHGLVLLDLPDHDSTQLSHRLEVDRLVGLVDLFVWVVDPQKYADAALHDRYLRPLAGHSGVTVVVLNQVDRLPPAAVEQCLGDLRRLLVADGLPEVPVVPVSARTGQGVGELQALLAEAVRRREAAVERTSADLDRVTEGLRRAAGDGEPGERIGREERDRLVAALANAAGVPAVVDAVGRSYRARSVAATGWPFTRWVRRLRPDPLRRLHLDSGSTDGRTSLPAPTPVARSQVQTAVRGVVEAVGNGLPQSERDALRGVAAPDEADLSDALDRAVAGTDLGVERRPLWWAALGALQWLLALVTVVGLAWLLVLFGLSWLRVPEPPTYRVGEVELPTLLALGGAAAGLLVALLGRVLAGLGARRRRRRAQARLRARIATVAEDLVFGPVEAELAAYRRLRAALLRAARR